VFLTVPEKGSQLLIRNIFLLSLLIISAASHLRTAFALETIRSQEINECRDDEIKTWGDGSDRAVASSSLKFTYNPKGSPEWFSNDQVLSMVTKASESWSQCGIATQMVPWNSKFEKQNSIVIVKWDKVDSGGNIGLANFRRRTLSLNPDVFVVLRAKNPKYDARETLQMVISHEMGHLFGVMSHSKRCIDVLSYYDNGKGEACFSRDPLWKNRMVEYRSSLPTACDINRCRKANGYPPLSIFISR
jgi:hypothetical protein